MTALKQRYYPEAQHERDGPLWVYDIMPGIKVETAHGDEFYMTSKQTLTRKQLAELYNINIVTPEEIHPGI